MWYKVSILISANVTGQGTRHLVEGTLDPLVGRSLIFQLFQVLVTGRPEFPFEGRPLFYPLVFSKVEIPNNG